MNPSWFWGFDWWFCFVPVPIPPVFKGMEGGRKGRRKSSSTTPSPAKSTSGDEGDTGGSRNTIKRASKGKWTVEEDEILKKAVSLHKGKNWKKIAEHLDGREDTQCLHRWQKVLNPSLVKGPWTKEVHSFFSFLFSSSSLLVLSFSFLLLSFSCFKTLWLNMLIYFELLLKSHDLLF